jgi:hypothetical protein
LAVGEQANKTRNGTVKLVASPPYGVGSAGVVGNGFAIDWPSVSGAWKSNKGTKSDRFIRRPAAAPT